VYVPSSDDHTHPADIQLFIDRALASPFFYVLGRHPRREAFIFAPNHNFTTYQAHFAVSERHRDGKTVQKAAEAGKWVFEHTECKAIMAFIREDNAPARVVLGQLGMSRIGKTNKTVLFNGTFLDEIIYQCTIDDFNDIWGEGLGHVGG
jgi:hypothetical protein